MRIFASSDLPIVLKALLLSLLFLVPVTAVMAQGSLYDETRVSSVYIGIPPDSLEVIMTDVLSNHYFMATFVFDDGTVRDTMQDVGFRLRGNTSRYAQKKSFKVSFNEYVPGRTYQGVKKLNLNGQHNDPTMVREKLYYDVWEDAGMAVRRNSFVRLYINGAYYGLYTNLEEFDKEWLERVYGESSGNLYKCTWPADLVYLGPDQQTYKNITSGSATGGRAYDLQTNEEADDYTDLVELITELDQPADSVFALRVAEKIDVDGVLKAFAIDVAAGHWDDYMILKNNYYLYHNMATGRFEFIAYDTDNTFGVDWLGQDWGTRDCLGWYNQDEERPLAEKLLAVPAFMDRYRRYLDTIARQFTNPGYIFGHVDSLETLITPAAIEDTFRTFDYGYTVADFFNGFDIGVDSHTPYGIKSFLSRRYESTLEQLAAAGIQDGTTSTSLLLWPNPAEDVISFSLVTANKSRSGSIIDMTGKKILSFAIPANTGVLTLSLSSLRPGIYIALVESAGFIASQRFMKR